MRRPGTFGVAPLVPLPTGLGRPGPPRDAQGDRVQPRGQGTVHPERSGPACQDQEDRLERILGLVLIAEDGAAGAIDRGAVPFDERREGPLR